MDFDFDKKVESVELLNGEIELTRSISIDSRYLIADFKIKNKKFSIQKKFQNTYDGNLELEQFKKQVDNEEKFRKYLGV